MPKKRFIVFISLIGLFALFLLIRYAQLMLGREVPAIARPRSTVERGPIVDRNGRFLAFQTRSANISARRPEIPNVEELAEELAPILEMSAAEIQQRITNAPGDYVSLKRRAGESAIEQINAARAQGRLRGVSLEPIVGRLYPEKNLASQIIGFVGDENDGLGGIEYAFNDELAGVGNDGKGSQIVLTIDANVQYILERIAGSIMEESQAEAVMFMAMDPRTGDILGSASLPNFDPNDIRSSSEIERMDRPAISAYEPGSVFKVFSISALMESNSIADSSIFVCNGSYDRISSLGEEIHIRCLGTHGRVGPREIIIHSCNAGTGYAADRLTNSVFYEYLRDYGFGSRSGAGSPGETAGFLRPVERWSERSKPTIAMGQEISVSALQMLQAASAIANDGILVPPKIVSRIVSADGKIVRFRENSPGRRVLRPEVARAMRSYMVDVTSNIGTGWRANVDDLSLAVKTGTAEIIDPVTRAYSRTDFIASCIALLPAESPSLVLYLVIIKPKGEYYGGRIAAPPIREAAEALVDYLGIPRGRNPQVGHSGGITLPIDHTPRIGSQVPSFYGLSKRTLLPLLLQDDIMIDIRGEGWVQRQSPPPGTPITADTVIILELE
ncbi:MAG: transpeptidase family protein [Treponema sp.]|jgi:cell division protein FtsI (penicillin-binding protein 3)|nr:transpeptidase family protein [Treponema sp.]